MKYKEIVINKCWGGFGLSHEAIILYAKFAGFKLYPFVECREKKGVKWSAYTGKFKPYTRNCDKDNPYDLPGYSKKPLKDGKYENDSYFSASYDIPRYDPFLVKVVKKLGSKSFGEFAKLKIVKVPVDIEWEIDNYDGQESIREKHRSWG